MKKLLIVFLVTLIVISGSMSIMYKDQVEEMIQIASNKLTEIMKGEQPPAGTPGDEDIKIESIALDTTGVKTVFDFGAEFTSEGLKVIATMSDGSTKEISLGDCRIVSPSTNKPGTKQVVVVYGDITLSYNITVNIKEVPSISATPLVNITDSDEIYRIEAEDFDMVTPGVKAAEGVTSFVSDGAEGTSGGKYLTGYSVAWNYFGFTFTAADEYEDSTIVLRLANSMAAGIDSGVVKMYLNFDQDENGEILGELPIDGYALEANSNCQWTEIVIRNLTIPKGTNTLTFEVQGENKAFDIDCIDLYVGIPYVKSIIEINGAGNIIKDLESLDTEKAIVEPSVKERENLKDGEVFLEKPQKGSANGGYCVAALYKGSQISTTLYLEDDATISINLLAGTENDRYIVDDFVFYIDGIKLTTVERKNIKGSHWWDWVNTNIGVISLSAGYHSFVMEAVGQECNIDTIEFNVISFGSYDNSGVTLEELTHVCESKCEDCGKCTDINCAIKICESKCVCGLGVDGIIAENNSVIIEAENLALDTLVGDSAGVTIEKRPHVTGVGHIAAGGYQIFKVKSTRDVTVAFSISFANAGGGSILQYIRGVYVNGAAITLNPDRDVPAGTGTSSNVDTYYWNLVTINLAVIELKADTEYEFKIMADSGNLDAYMLDVLYVGGHEHSCADGDGKCDNCGVVIFSENATFGKGGYDLSTNAKDEGANYGNVNDVFFKFDVYSDSEKTVNLVINAVAVVNDTYPGGAADRFVVKVNGVEVELDGTLTGPSSETSWWTKEYLDHLLGTITLSEGINIIEISPKLYGSLNEGKMNVKCFTLTEKN